MLQNAYSTQRRGGMVLIIVLALLAMVGLTAVTFLLTTGQLKDASEQNRQMGESTIDPDSMLQDAVMQVIRGTKFTTSPLYGNSLLEDMYGKTDTTRTENCTAVTTLEDGMIVLNCTGGNAENVGRVITCIDPDSPSNGMSSVILKFENGKYYCLPFPNGKTFEAGLNGGEVEFLINDAPFQGVCDYDAFDTNNYFLAARDSSTGVITSTLRSFRNAASNYGLVDADNDGSADASWLDIGTPIYISANGKLFKPLFGFVVEDMDGRLNVNAQGDLYDRLGKNYGLGRGPAEIGLNVLDTALSISTDNLIRSRFSSNYATVSTASPDKFSTDSHKGGWYAGYESTITGTGVQRTPYDIRGVLKPSVELGGEASYSLMGSSAVTAASGHIQVGSSSSLSLNPYDLDLGLGHVSGIYASGSAKPNTAQDMPYSPSELEALLRPYDFDTPFLPSRLARRLGVSSSSSTRSMLLRTLITTESWDVPVIPKEAAAALRNDEGMLPEIIAGWPLDLLRAATFNDSTDPVQGDGRFKKREDFAKCLYKILQYLNVNMGEGDEAQSRNNAQWAVNVVDFLDADSVMTPFNYDGGNWVYGCERPELLLVETMALHSKNTEYDVKSEDGHYVGGKMGKKKNDDDTEVYEENAADDPFDDRSPTAQPKARKILADLNDDKIGPDSKVDFDQLIRPQGSLFVEIYNPWTQNEKFPTISNDIFSSANARAVDITKKGGDDSVWRLVVMKPGAVSTDWTSQPRDETDPSWNDADVERAVDFAPGTTPGTGSVAKYSAKAGASVELLGGEYVLVGPEGLTVLSFTDPGKNAVESVDASAQERVINMNTASKKVDGASYPQKMLPIADTNGIRMSLTEDSNSNYPSYDASTLELKVPLDRPLDYGRSDWSSLLKQNKTHSNYRILHLQRLANPSRAYDKSTNPYITVDSMSVDLTVYNARTTQKDTDNDETGTVSTIITRKRGKNAAASATALWEQSKTLGNETASGSASTGNGAFNGNFDQSFGKGITDSASIPWLGWINRPPVSPFELMNVTYLPSNQLLLKMDFETDDSSGLKRYGFLPDFSGKAGLKKVFGFLRVPSPQTVTPMVLNKNNLPGTFSASAVETLPFAYYSMYREPGKININTINDKNVYAALMNLSTSGGNLETQWSSFRSSRDSKPFRSLAESPENSILRDFSLFKGTDAGTSDGTSDKYHPFFRIQDYYRLANLATTRSNVFAVWITMGFFEVDSNGNVTTNELGSDMGDIKRYRAFYLIDRSIPVGFERGVNHNAENVIILKRMLQ